jgi:hypothetical protein
MPYYSALRSPIFEPAITDIIAITNSFPAIVTTGKLLANVLTPIANTYKSGLIARMVVPYNYGMYEINDIKSPITVLTDTTFSIPINTTNFNTFIVPTEATDQPLFNVAQVVPVGEIAANLDQSFVNILTPQF